MTVSDVFILLMLSAASGLLGGWVAFHRLCERSCPCAGCAVVSGCVGRVPVDVDGGNSGR